MRELNSNDICEINKIKFDIDTQTKDTEQLTIDESSIESQIQIQCGKIESMNNKLDAKIQELDDKAFEYEECEAEIIQFETQVENFRAELAHLQDLEIKYKEENEDLTYKIKEEARKNMELSKQVNNIETKVNKLESKLSFLRTKADAKNSK